MKIAVGLSGGVDSSVAAAKLVEQGHEVVGVTMRIWPDSTCCGSDAIRDAAVACWKLGIEHKVFDLTDRFREEIVQPFLDTYAEGRTPNPCPTCNQRLKFHHLWQVAREATGAERIATGHYARVRLDPETGMHQLFKGVDRKKDQSYMLFRLDQAQLASLVTPLGDRTKEQTRDDAQRLELWHVAEKPDSQDLCFTSGNLSSFLARHLPDQEQEGTIVDSSGREIGKHPGAIHYTVGQRRGLGVAAAEPLYVLDVLPRTNTVVAGPRSETFKSAITVDDVRWTSIPVPTGPLRAEVKVRHSPHVVWATLEPDGTSARIAFDDPQPGIAPGQFAVFHHDDLVLGGGTIGR